jgi:arsenate reductase
LGITVRALLREKEGTPFAELGLGDPSLSDDAMLDAMMPHLILITDRRHPKGRTPLPAV